MKNGLPKQDPIDPEKPPQKYDRQNDMLPSLSLVKPNVVAVSKTPKLKQSDYIFQLFGFNILNFYSKKKIP